MKPAIKDFAELFAETFPIIEPVYEFGSFQDPGQQQFANLRLLFPGKEYIGTDMREGSGVDMILDLHDIDLPSESVGTILCLDILEHVEYPHKALEQMYRILKPDGILVISSVMLWPIHDHPYDYWRFTPEAFRSLLKPFTYSFVGFAGDELFPHTVVGVGSKKEISQPSMFQEKYSAWQSKNLVQIIGQNWQPKYLASTNQAVSSEQQTPAYETLSSQLAAKEQELSEIYRSKAWHLIQFLRRIRLAILPHGSSRKKEETSPAVAHTIAKEVAIKPDPIIVHQMGKVGSKTVELSLHNAYEGMNINVPIYHIHILNDFDNLEAQAVRERPDPADFISAINQGRNLREQIDSDPAQRWKIITLVRDPIARNVGTFFHNLQDFIPDWRQHFSEGKLNVHDFQEMFLKIESITGWPEYWFDSQMKSIPAFGIDVYADLFPRALGYKIYKGTKQADLLLIRLEDLNTCAETAMREFLSLENFVLHDANIGENKDYAEMYRAFKKLPLPGKYIQMMYKTRYARHFYSESELHAFAMRWGQSSE